jgi:hypothetical protein
MKGWARHQLLRGRLAIVSRLLLALGAGIALELNAPAHAQPPTPQLSAAGALASDNFGRVVPLGWGRDLQGAPWRIFRLPEGVESSVLGSVDGSRGVLSVPGEARPVQVIAGIGPQVADGDFHATLDASQDGMAFGLVMRGSADGYYLAQVVAGTRDLWLTRFNSTVIGYGRLPAIAAAGVATSFHLQIEGDQIRVRVWPDGLPEPTTWAVQVTDPDGVFPAGINGIAAQGVRDVPVQVRVRSFTAQALVAPVTLP